MIFFKLKGRPESIFPTLPHVTKCTLAEVPALDYDTTKELQQRLTYGLHTLHRAEFPDKSRHVKH